MEEMKKPCHTVKFELLHIEETMVLENQHLATFRAIIDSGKN